MRKPLLSISFTEAYDGKPQRKPLSKLVNKGKRRKGKHSKLSVKRHLK